MSVASPPRPRTLTPGELAWVAILPVAVVTVALIVLVGPAIGHAFLAPHGEPLWPSEAHFVFGRVEPVKHGRYVVSLLGPALLAAAVLAGRRRGVRLGAEALGAAVLAAQVVLAAFLIAAVLGQNSAIFPLEPPIPHPWHIFGPARYAFALAAPLLLLAALRRTDVSARIAAAARETRARRLACLALATAFVAIWLLPAVDTDGTIGHSPGAGLIPWTMDDSFAILNGSGPLVGYHAMYAHLWPYLTAATMQLFGATIGVFTVTLVAVAGLALLAVYAVLRRVLRSSPLALALFLPLVAIGFLPVRLSTSGAPIWFSNAQVFSIWPLRSAGPCFLAWLTARHVDGAQPRRPWPLFLAAGVVLINNVEFGAGALVATVAALACTPAYRSRATVLRLAGEAAAGLLGALLLVTLLTLGLRGKLPHLADVLEFPRIFGVLGLTGLPMPLFGFQLVLYSTYLAAIGIAAVRVAQRAEQQVLTAMLAWSGVFGLLAASYWIGRSDDLKLVALFSSWAFALSLVAIAVVRGLAARAWRRPLLAELAVLAGVALTATALLRTPAPWSQVARLGRTTTFGVMEQPTATQFVARETSRGERVVILSGLGHRIAYDTGRVDVSPYAFLESVVTRRQFDVTIAVARREGAHKLFLPTALLVQAHLQALAADGFSRRAASGGVSEWSDLAAGPG